MKSLLNEFEIYEKIMKEYECTGSLNVNQDKLNIVCIMSLLTRFGLDYLKQNFSSINHISNKNNPNIIFKNFLNNPHLLISTSVHSSKWAFVSMVI
ncbi:MAG: hypothetical protein BZ137_06655 [Methanosphaera sp. rholeuAM130]|nr:MAG: hypothetical protein BZ137_06655 [Methanosphaera sp. rholeuAM130]